MSERVIAVCSPELHGDVLWTVPAARALARRHNCRADYWLSSRSKNVADLLGAQRFVRQVIVDESWLLHPNGIRQFVNGAWLEEPVGRSHDILAAAKEKHGYEAVYQLGFRAHVPLGGTLLDYFCQVAAAPRQGHYFDLPEGCPAEPVPGGPFVAMTNKWDDGNINTEWRRVFRDFAKNCPIPIVEVGEPGTAVATDLGALDRTRHGFLEMAGVISRCKYFLGYPSAPLVVADAMPHVVRLAVTKGEVNINSGTTAGGKNFYIRADSYLEILNYIEEAR